MSWWSQLVPRGHASRGAHQWCMWPATNWLFHREHGAGEVLGDWVPCPTLAAEKLPPLHRDTYMAEEGRQHVSKEIFASVT